MKQIELVQRLDFIRQLLHPEHQHLIRISDQYDLIGDWSKRSWPDNEQPGVYFLLNTQEELLYIGKSSVCIGSRLNAHFHNSPERECVSYSRELSSIRFIWTIGIPKDKWFLSTAIEEYLIAELNPPVNKIGRIT